MAQCSSKRSVLTFALLQSSVAVLAVCLMLIIGRPVHATTPPAVYPTPEAAAKAILDALAKGDHASLITVLGDEYADQLFIDDAALEHQNYQRVLDAAKEAMQLRADDDNTRVMVLGKDAWPMPIPIVRDDKGWHFDTGAGVDEIVARRIGTDELAAIQALRAYVTAQMQYASEDRDGDDVLEYAQKFVSSPGKKDGLYWETTSADDEPSPFGPFIAEQGDYLKEHKPGDSYKGYYYRILTRQGENPPGGRYDYIINGNMIAGFAAIAVPADYGDTGVMTFVVSHQGKIYQKDLGKDTALAAAAIQEYNPDDTWTLVKESE
ncbi:MAG TPA: DUF2950 domain-containing protein [Methylomirabilota bacterium]|nr:DUF2950 domain-containing protein [Methylomirabilota bacterium]